MRYRLITAVHALLLRGPTCYAVSTVVTRTVGLICSLEIPQNDSCLRRLDSGTYATAVDTHLELVIPQLRAANPEVVMQVRGLGGCLGEGPVWRGRDPLLRQRFEITCCTSATTVLYCGSEKMWSPPRSRPQRRTHHGPRRINASPRDCGSHQAPTERATHPLVARDAGSRRRHLARLHR